VQLLITTLITYRCHVLALIRVRRQFFKRTDEFLQRCLRGGEGIPDLATAGPKAHGPIGLYEKFTGQPAWKRYGSVELIDD